MSEIGVEMDGIDAEWFATGLGEDDKYLSNDYMGSTAEQAAEFFFKDFPDAGTCWVYRLETQNQAIRNIFETWDPAQAMADSLQSHAAMYAQNGEWDFTARDGAGMSALQEFRGHLRTAGMLLMSITGNHDYVPRRVVERREYQMFDGKLERLEG